MNKEIFRSEKGHTEISTQMLLGAIGIATAVFGVVTQNRLTRIENKLDQLNNRPTAGQQIRPGQVPANVPATVTAGELQPFIQNQ